MNQRFFLPNRRFAEAHNPQHRMPRSTLEEIATFSTPAKFSKESPAYMVSFKDGANEKPE
jgi:hypothetical protein